MSLFGLGLWTPAVSPKTDFIQRNFLKQKNSDQKNTKNRTLINIYQLLFFGIPDNDEEDADHNYQLSVSLSLSQGWRLYIVQIFDPSNFSANCCSGSIFGKFWNCLSRQLFWKLSLRITFSQVLVPDILPPILVANFFANMEVVVLVKFVFKLLFWTIFCKLTL